MNCLVDKTQIFRFVFNENQFISIYRTHIVMYHLSIVDQLSYYWNFFCTIRWSRTIETQSPGKKICWKPLRGTGPDKIKYLSSSCRTWNHIYKNTTLSNMLQHLPQGEQPNFGDTLQELIQSITDQSPLDSCLSM